MSKNNSSMLQLKIQLRNVTKPPVWRRVLVPSDITFHELHYIIHRRAEAFPSLSQTVGLLSQALGQIWEAWIFHHPGGVRCK